MRRLLIRLLSPLLALPLLAGGGYATWSIVCVNVETGEVCVASATCLSNLNLEFWVPLVRVGKGGAAAQSFVDVGGINRMYIWEQMEGLGASPRDILLGLSQNDSQHQTRQYGIVTFRERPITFTGTGAGFARHGVTGQVGPIKYAIQGNVLAGDAVVTEAEGALWDTEGDLSQKVMAAMEAARFMGGDGRCSCSNSQPDSCGSPPPDFEKSAHVAFIIVARIGDTEGTCTSSGCATGDYYLNIQRVTGTAPPDPVRLLFGDYFEWREQLLARPDHILSRVETTSESLVADGHSRTSVAVSLVDVEGLPLTLGGAAVTVEWLGQGEPTALPSVVLDNQDGTYSFELQATTTVGNGRWGITVDDGVRPVRLFPDLMVRTEHVRDLHAGYGQVAASDGADVPFFMNFGAAREGDPYMLLGSASGTDPGQVFHGAQLRLNDDAFFQLTLDEPGAPMLPGSIGVLGPEGRAAARFVLSPAELAPFVGRTLDWAAVVGGGVTRVSNIVTFDVVP